MIVLHGDYKDFNFISYGVKPTTDEGHLPLIWEQFLKGKYNLTERRIQNQDYFDCYKIFITHYVFDTNCYTSYSVVDKTKTDFFLPALSLLVGVSPAQEHKCFAEGNTLMSAPISERIPIAVKVLFTEGTDSSSSIGTIRLYKILRT